MVGAGDHAQVHRQWVMDALLRRVDPSRLAVGTCVEAKGSVPLGPLNARLTAHARPRPPTVDPTAQPLERPPQRTPTIDACTGRTPQKPLLLVDIDGVLSLFGFPPHAPPEGSLHFIDGIPHFLSSTATRHLLALVSLFELVWCSGWEEKADEHLPHLLGLPRGRPHLSFERKPASTGGRDQAGADRDAAVKADGGGAAGKSLRGHWKLAAIDAYAGKRALAWIDDCLDAACHAWAQARDAPTLLVQTSPEQGLTDREASQLRAWAQVAGGVQDTELATRTASETVASTPVAWGGTIWGREQAGHNP